jgi:hypothetical protein
VIAAALVIGTPFFIVFGGCRTSIGRKPIIMAGCLIAALTYFPLFKALTAATPIRRWRIRASQAPVRHASPIRLLVPVQSDGHGQVHQSCDIAKSGAGQGRR